MRAKRKIPKPFSEMTLAEQIESARNSLANLRHPHNRYQPSIYDAIRRWEDWAKAKGVTL